MLLQTLREQSRAKKKQGVIDKMKTFFEKYFGIGGSTTFTEPEHKEFLNDINPNMDLSMAIEGGLSYDADEEK